MAVVQRWRSFYADMRAAAAGSCGRGCGRPRAGGSRRAHAWGRRRAAARGGGALLYIGQPASLTCVPWCIVPSHRTRRLVSSPHQFFQVSDGFCALMRAGARHGCARHPCTRTPGDAHLPPEMLVSHRYPSWLVGCPKRTPGDAVDAPRLVYSADNDDATPSTRHDLRNARVAWRRAAKLQRDTRQQQESLNALRASDATRKGAARRGASPRWHALGLGRRQEGRARPLVWQGRAEKLEQRTAAGRAAAAASRRDGRFWDLPVEKWSVADCGDWLVSLDLAQYWETFSRNEISRAANCSTWVWTTSTTWASKL